MPHRPLEAVSLTDVGRVRTCNEDSLAVDDEHGIAVLADGMGGHRSGEVASRMAAEIIVGALRARVAELAPGTDGTPGKAVEQAMAQANRKIYEAAQSRSTCQGMGTTVALALFHGNHVTLGHVGDSRIYLLRGDRLELLTRDDSLLHDQVEVGLISAANAADSHNRHLLTRALGMHGSVSVHLREAETMPGDIFLLCSDGLNDLVEDADIELILGSLKANLPLAAHHLVQAANDNGGHDNVSVILARVLAPFPAAARKGWAGRLLGRLRESLWPS